VVDEARVLPLKSRRRRDVEFSPAETAARQGAGVDLPPVALAAELVQRFKRRAARFLT